MDANIWQHEEKKLVTGQSVGYFWAGVGRRNARGHCVQVVPAKEREHFCKVVALAFCGLNKLAFFEVEGADLQEPVLGKPCGLEGWGSRSSMPPTDALPSGWKDLGSSEVVFPRSRPKR